MALTTFRNDMRITGDLTVDGATTIAADAATATAVTAAATLAAKAGKITTEALTTAQNLFYTLTITNTAVKATDIAVASVANGTNTQGTPMVCRVTPGAGTLVVEIQNKHASAQALNGTLVISFLVVTTV